MSLKPSTIGDLKEGDYLELPVPATLNGEIKFPTGSWLKVTNIVYDKNPNLRIIYFDQYTSITLSEHMLVLISDRPENIAPRTDVMEWDAYFLNIAQAVSLRAKCRRRKVGSIIVDKEQRIISSGYNGFPAGSIGDCLSGRCPRSLTKPGDIPPDSPYTDPSSAGFCPALHSEANALLHLGQYARGCTMYVTDRPCPDCARLIAGAGIIRVVWPEGEMNPMDFYAFTV